MPNRLSNKAAQQEAEQQENGFTSQSSAKTSAVPTNGATTHGTTTHQSTTDGPRNSDWSDAAKDLLDSLPKVWTRGLLYFLVIFATIVLPWSMLSRIDETGTAKGRLEPKGTTSRLDASVPGTVAKILVKEGDAVKAGQRLLLLESKVAGADLRQAQEKLQGQLNQLSQLKLLKKQGGFSLTAQEQQNRSQALEKQSQVAQARQNLDAISKSSRTQQEEKLAQVKQAQQNLIQSENARNLAETSLASAQREAERYQKAWNRRIVAEINFVEKKDALQERQKVYEQALSEVEQNRLRLAEQQSSYKRTVDQGKADVAQARLRLKEQERSLQSLTQSGKLAILKSKEQQGSQEREMAALQAEISQLKSQIGSLKFQVGQRAVVAPVNGTVFQLPIQSAGTAVQPGTLVAEVAPEGTPLVVRAQMLTSDSGFVRKGLPVKMKFDAYPFQDYGVMEGKVAGISPTSSEVETPNGKVPAYKVEIVMNQQCLRTGSSKCIKLRPGQTVTAEVIVRQRRIADLLLDPFKKLQQGEFKL